MRFTARTYNKSNEIVVGKLVDRDRNFDRRFLVEEHGTSVLGGGGIEGEQFLQQYLALTAVPIPPPNSARVLPLPVGAIDCPIFFTNRKEERIMCVCEEGRVYSRAFCRNEQTFVVDAHQSDGSGPSVAFTARYRAFMP